MAAAAVHIVRSLPGQLVLRLLAHGDWMPLDQLKQQVARRIPPGPAIRAYQSRAEARERREGPRTSPMPPEHMQIRLGAKALASDAVTKLKQNYLDVEDDGAGGRRIRLRPQHLADAQAIFRAPAGPGELDEYRPEDEPDDGDEPDDEPAKHAPAKHEPATHVPSTYAPAGRDARVRSSPDPPQRAFAATRDEVRDVVREQVEAALDGFQVGLHDFLVDLVSDLYTDLAALLVHTAARNRKPQFPPKYNGGGRHGRRHDRAGRNDGGRNDGGRNDGGRNDGGRNEGGGGRDARR